MIAWHITAALTLGGVLVGMVAQAYLMAVRDMWHDEIGCRCLRRGYRLGVSDRRELSRETAGEEAS